MTADRAVAGLLTRCTADLTEDDRLTIATEMAGAGPDAIVRTMQALLNGLEARCADDETALAAILALREWHLPDLGELAGARCV